MASSFNRDHGLGEKKEIVTYRVLVTGANTGLGYAICTRLIETFLDVRDLHEHLHLIVATRSEAKCEKTIRSLRSHMKQWKNKQIAQGNGRLIQDLILKESQADPFVRVAMSGEIVDLCDLMSVRELADRLLTSKIGHLDVLICNAGVGGWDGMKWPQAVKDVLTNMVQAVTWPRFKRSVVGTAAEPQFQRTSAGRDSESKTDTQEKVSEHPALGHIFCSNLFGHYLLGHYLTPLLSKVPTVQEARGRIIWISSLEAYDYALNLDDIQGLEAEEPYESSKRLTDLLALSSELKSTAPWASKYLGTGEKKSESSSGTPSIYLTHPGICATGIAAMPFVLHYAMIVVFYLARILGSPWHTVSAYIGAAAPVYLALVPQTQLDVNERTRGLGKSKWGSGTNRIGSEMVSRTEVEGWGLGGKIGTDPEDWEMRREQAGPVTVARVVGREEKEGFETRAIEAWREMEGLREDWEGRIEKEWKRKLDGEGK
ncbi:hypothetical protein P152DRAFT_414469 [Eremomyces bilateralis CBS 781.70]|uniref:3-keto-steroid reductase n=1 Tax=Eremomyces bilateralis CBS 781.70 TaxID=1392243 RepID=A0A6G1G7G7_9PEZI|nr:uncharacterized protein P152DRAFT_414469 [Eremomyces bilateralis CBS 781.70]KAF1813952.1 hypothetical protein P152DRAFT_414469 [Eremomyces bilateralis CBS 781.70]